MHVRKNKGTKNLPVFYENIRFLGNEETGENVKHLEDGVTCIKVLKLLLPGEGQESSQNVQLTFWRG